MTTKHLTEFSTTKFQLHTTVLWPLHGTMCISQHPKLGMRILLEQGDLYRLRTFKKHAHLHKPKSATLQKFSAEKTLAQPFTLNHRSIQANTKEERYLLVLVDVDRLELTESNEVCADENTQLTALLFTFLTVASVSLMLHAHPQLVHLSKVELNEVD